MQLGFLFVSDFLFSCSLSFSFVPFSCYFYMFCVFCVVVVDDVLNLFCMCLLRGSGDGEVFRKQNVF